jgi:hypothetical protein
MNMMKENMKLFKQRESSIMEEYHFVTEEEIRQVTFNEI